jgi:hypothetical protein
MRKRTSEIECSRARLAFVRPLLRHPDFAWVTSTYSNLAHFYDDGTNPPSYLCSASTRVPPLLGDQHVIQCSTIEKANDIVLKLVPFSRNRTAAAPITNPGVQHAPVHKDRTLVKLNNFAQRYLPWVLAEPKATG